MNTLSITDQDCLIHGTIPYTTEETLINDILDNDHTDTITIILYGKHSADSTVV
jgi:hypothetical protein